MSDELQTVQGTKEEQYQNLFPQIKALMSSEGDIIAKMSNLIAALKQQFNWFWIGFYRVQDNSLIVGPFQGPIACVRIEKSQGVCGRCWQDETTLIVSDVQMFPGHIACSNKSKSEIVIPVFQNGKPIAVLDVDSEYLDTFDKTDAQWLAKIVSLLSDEP